MKTNPRPMGLVARVLIVLVLVGISRPATAQEFRLSVSELKAASSSVVLGRTVKTEVFWNEDRSAILTRVTLQVEDRLMGESPAEVEIIIPGGRIGNYTHEVSDMPSFVVDDESVVFLERHSSGVNVVSGGSQGKFEVERDRTTLLRTVKGVQGLFPGLEDRSVDVQTASDDIDLPLTLEEFKARLRGER